MENERNEKSKNKNIRTHCHLCLIRKCRNKKSRQGWRQKAKQIYFLANWKEEYLSAFKVLNGIVWCVILCYVLWRIWYWRSRSKVQVPPSLVDNNKEEYLVNEEYLHVKYRIPMLNKDTWRIMMKGRRRESEYGGGNVELQQL